MLDSHEYCNLGNKCISLNSTYPGKISNTFDCIKSGE